MIERIKVEGYRRFSKLNFAPIPGMNIIVGDNESGKSTLLEAVGLALTGRVNGKWAAEELNPHWFHQDAVAKFFKNHRLEPPPEIHIELYLCDSDLLQPLRGVHNSLGLDCPGVTFRVAPSDSYAQEFRTYLESDPPWILPVEYYWVDWRSFADHPLHQRPKELSAAFIDARTIRSTSGVDYQTRQMLKEHLDPNERAAISVAHRRSRQALTDGVLAPINRRIAAERQSLHNKPLGLHMDQSSRATWESAVAPQVEGIPFAMAGQGQQASIKVALAMNRTSGVSAYVLIEEPENHLSYTTLTRLLAQVEGLANANQQLFITTHSSYVLNKLGLDRLILLHDGRPTRLTDLEIETVSYFRKLAGYDTLRLVLANRLALVEGPSDALILERAFLDRTGQLAISQGIDVLSVGGLTFKRALELCSSLSRDVVALQDNDGRRPEDITHPIEHLLDEKRILLVSDPTDGPTLEPQLFAANPGPLLQKILGIGDGVDVVSWMKHNKTEAALRIHDAKERIAYPPYICKAVDLLSR